MAHLLKAIRSLVKGKSRGSASTSRQFADLDGGQDDAGLAVGEIRVFDVLSIDSDATDDTVHIRTRKMSLRNIEAYCTLSYTWGETADDGSHLTHTVFQNGRPIGVTENLYHALLRIRDLWDELWDDAGTRTSAWAMHGLYTSYDLGHREPLCDRPALWADAICINQGDHRERNSQVRIMGNIYQSSAHLLIWLGKEFGLDSNALTDVQQMLKSPWFTRRWVVQEAISQGRDSSILLNNEVLPREKLWSLICQYDLVTLASPLDTPQLSYGSRDDLLTNLDKYSDKACSDPRDRVYALLSISSDVANLQVDYSLTVLEVYIKVAGLYIASGAVSRVLLHALLRTGHAANGDWPSWVPDWRTDRPSGRTVRHFLHYDKEYMAYNNRRKKALKNSVEMRQRTQESSRVTLEQAARITQSVNRPHQYSLQLDAWVVTTCHGSRDGTDCTQSPSDQSCIYCQFQGRANRNAGSVICLLKDSPCAFWLSPDLHNCAFDDRHYRLQDYINYVVCWDQGQPFWLRRSDTGLWSFPPHSLVEMPRIVTLM